MAASPPPYPPSSQEQRRQQKAYWQAQKDAARGQRDYWRSQRRDQRYYWRAMHRPSVVGPILILAIGVVALLIETGKLSSSFFWDWFLRWWPLLLVGIGLVSLLEWFLDRGQPYRRRTNAFGIVLLVSILVGIAYSKNHMRGFSFPFDNGSDPWAQLTGEEHERHADNFFPVPSSPSVQVQNPRGDVTIAASSDGQMHVETHQVVNSNSDNDANRAFPSLDPKVTVSGNNVLLRIEGSNNGRADLTIELPEGATTDVNAGRGDVSIEGLKGASNVNAGRGDVKLSGIGGNVHVHMSKGDFSAHEIAGNVSLDGHLGDVTVSEVTGSLSLEGEFFGDTHLEQISSSVRFHSSRTDMEIGRLAGDLTMDSDDLHIGQAVGPLRIVTRSKNIECSQVSGDVHIENANGEVSVTAADPLGSIQITNSSEPVTVTLPPNAGFSVEAATNGGDINTDFNLNVSGSDEKKAASGTVGKGGPKIELTVRHGDISIRKGDANMAPIAPLAPLPPKVQVSPLAPKAPVAPKAPLAPAVPEKHLRAPEGVKAEPDVL